jgi:hypothetical protein
VVVVERLLDRVQLAVSGEALDGRDLEPVGLDAEHRARLHGLTVHEHRAGPARGRLAPDVRPGEAEALAKDVHEEVSGLQLELVPRSVHGQRYASQSSPLPRVGEVRA